MPTPGSESPFAAVSKIADALCAPAGKLDVGEFGNALTGLGAYAQQTGNPIEPVTVPNLRTAQNAGTRLRELLVEVTPPGNAAAATAHPKTAGELSEMQSILGIARALRRLAVVSDLLGEQQEITLSLKPNVFDHGVGQWNCIYGHSGPILNQCVSGQILSESGTVKISTLISESPYAKDAFCYLLTVTTSPEYGKEKTLQILLNADPDNAARGQVAEWTGPLVCSLGIFYCDPFLGGTASLNIPDRAPENFLEPEAAAYLPPPEFTDPAQKANRTTRQFRDFTKNVQENVADWIIGAILERRLS